MEFVKLIFDNVRRNITRTLLTSLGTIVLVCVVTLIWSVLAYLGEVTREQTSNIKGIVTERWRIPSQMPYSYAATIKEGAAREEDDVRPADAMTWTFFVGTLTPGANIRDDGIFIIFMEPEKLVTMMDELDRLKGEALEDWKATVARLQETPQGIIVGKTRLEAMNKRVGERIIVHGVNYKGIDMEFEIVGTFPIARYDQTSAADMEYFKRALFDAYPLANNGQAHPMAEKSVNLVWVRTPDTATFTQVADQIMNAPALNNPAVKVETAASGIASFLEAYRDIFWGVRWVLSPSIIITLALIISNAISISVRERRMEFAIMKVLGFRPVQILLLVLCEALLIGAASGVISAGGTYLVVNYWFDGLKIPIGFFPAFYISSTAPLWGLAIGAGAALAGSLLPAWNACRVRVAEVFGRVA